MVLPLVAAAALPALARVGMEASPAVAQWLGRQIAGDPAIGDRAAEVVRAVTGTDDPIQAEAAMADPGTRSEVAQRLAELAVEQDRIAAAEMASARARDVALRQAGASRRMPSVLVGIGVGGVVMAVVAMLVGSWMGLPEGGAVMAVLITIAVGFLAIIKDAAAFEFGSSLGSRNKDAPGPFVQGKGRQP